ncbi:hypothetical protein DOTSEDRAFT_25662 [Dothistroma septosporum NZE10]|uniref:Uncharacterized protein n=1 Tax=Dothistroma septosporum (strain NZE10 / CBS 128990) TaxID=675120 RepID=N1PIP7_DOTSN|nr:hypothetical protein DOTSEDRAFT_25662 [Dothistroma septosporum NZE10]
MEAKERGSGYSSDDDSFNEEKLLLQGPSQSNHPQRRRCLNARTFMLVFNVILFLTGVSVWTQVGMLIKTKNLTCPVCDEVEADLRYDSPVLFQPNWAMVVPPTNVTNEIWQRLSPPGEGFVEVANEVARNLPPSRVSERRPDTHKVYGVSVFHQLHCVNMLRLNMYPEEFHWTLPGESAEQIRKHRDHCIDYLRQAIMCNADVTFEPWGEAGINGMGAIHQCRDYQKIFTWAFNQRYNRTKDVFNPV